jgi:general secretion pathway protein D
MLKHVKCGLVMVVVLAAMAAGCASGRAFQRAETAAKAGDWDTAVEFYRQAVQQNPDRPDYKIALERAMLAAAAAYAERGRQLEAAGELDQALRAYRKAEEFEPSNRQLATKAAEIERRLRAQIEAAQPRPEIERLREQAAQQRVEPILNPASREPLSIRFTNASIRDILNFIGNATGINVTYDRDYQDRAVTVQLEGVTLEQALHQIMIANQLFYKVLNERTIIVAQDTTQKRTQYEEQVIRTYFVSHADATELAQLLTGLLRVAGVAIQPQISPNKTANTITVRATTSMAQIVERVIQANDKPRAEVAVDVQILEVSRERAKQYGLDLNSYAASLYFTPEQAPTSGQPSSSPFNLNTISQGVSTADFYLQVPSAIVRFLESDSQTKVLAKPNLRGTEGQKLTLNLGEEVPIPSTTFLPIAGGGAPTNPLASFNYRPVGIIVDMTPRVTYEGDIILEIVLENSARGQDTNIAGQNLPSFTSRKVTTKLRLRDGESNLLAGLLREDERRSLRGFPGVMRLPVLKQLFSANDESIRQTDIVMLLTPRIIRTHELTAADLSPIYIGTQSNMALGGPPPLIGGPEAAVSPPVTPGVAPSPLAGTATPPTVSGPQPLVVTPGASPRPGLVPAPVPAPATPPAQPAPPAEPAVPAAAAAPITPEPPAAAAQPAPPAAPAAAPPARISMTLPSEMRVGSGPYTVPVSVSGATRLSTITLSITYNPALVRARSVQEGSFMRQGGATAVFTQDIDAGTGRIDIAITRPGDQTGASTGGVLAAVLFEPVAAGSGTISVSGSGAVPGGGAAALQFLPATVTVK